MVECRSGARWDQAWRGRCNACRSPFRCRHPASGNGSAGVHGMREMSAALDLTSVLAVGIPASLYAAGSFKLWGRGGRIPLWQLLCGAAGFLVLALTLLSPLHEIGERLFSAHMIEHEVLMAVAAPIVVLARPALPILWGIPRFARRAIGITSRRIADSLLFRARSEEHTSELQSHSDLVCR